mmetsp:Transcript_55215/g.87551  ORF Transcript_55215/g.87551 Transcript_55215/m.87551 type:complete len:170 (+) Transcript_55215:137-646(+)
MLRRCNCTLVVVLTFATLNIAHTEYEESNVEILSSLAASNDDAKDVLEKTQQETSKMQMTVSRVLHKSTEEVKTLKSLLTTNAKGASALNDLFNEMTQLTKRIAQYENDMESCQREIQNMKVQSEQILSPEQANDPLIGGESLVQLRHHAQTLHQQIHEAVKVHAASAS